MKLARWIALFAAVLLLAGWGPRAEAAQEVTRKKGKYNWKMANPAPRNVSHAIAFEKILVPEIERCTNGELGFKMYWGGIMGDDDDMIQKMRIGQLHACGLTGLGTLKICPEMTVMALPFMFRDYDEVDFIKSRMFPTFDKSAEKHGFKLFFIIDQGFDPLFSVDQPITKLEDFKQSRFLSWQGALETTWLETLGITPVTLSFPEMPSGLRQGIYNALLVPSLWVVAAQTYTQIKYVNPTRIRYSPASPVAAVKPWMELPAKYRKNLTDGRVRVEKIYCTDTRKGDDRVLEALLHYGLRQVDFDSAALKELKGKTRPSWYEMAGTYYSRETLDEIVGLLREYRAGKDRAQVK